MDVPEISDLIVSFDPDTLARRPVPKQDVVQTFRSLGNRKAARIVERIPELYGMLDPEAVDKLLIRVHCEMQRLSEEFQHGQRMYDLLEPVMTGLRVAGAPRPFRLVDVGCGTGYVVRWLAAHTVLASEAELTGADCHPALVQEAQRLAHVEKLDCRFVVANAFRLAEPATIYFSTGVLHHFRGEDLTRFFAGHERPETLAFVHFDFQPSRMAPLGSWLFHTIRFRQPLAKHDGVVSAMRAHDGDTLLAAAKAGAPGFQAAIYSNKLWRLPIPRAFHCIMGVRPQYREHLVRALLDRTSQLGAWQ